MMTTPPVSGSLPTYSSSGANLVAKPLTSARSATRFASSSAVPRLEPYSTAAAYYDRDGARARGAAAPVDIAAVVVRGRQTAAILSVRGRTLILKPSGLMVSVSFNTIWYRLIDQLETLQDHAERKGRLVHRKAAADAGALAVSERLPGVDGPRRFGLAAEIFRIERIRVRSPYGGIAVQRDRHTVMKVPFLRRYLPPMVSSLSGDMP